MFRRRLVQNFDPPLDTSNQPVDVDVIDVT